MGIVKSWDEDLQAFIWERGRMPFLHYIMSCGIAYVDRVSLRNPEFGILAFSHKAIYCKSPMEARKRILRSLPSTASPYDLHNLKIGTLNP